MKSPRKFRASTASRVSLAALAALGLIACGSGTDSSDEAQNGGDSQSTHQWDFFIIVPLSHPVGVEAQRFADEVEEATNGEVQITVRPPGELPISAPQAHNAVRDNDIQIAEGYVGNLAADMPFAGVMSLPMLASSIEEGDQAIDAIMGDIETTLDQYNAELLWTFHWGMQTIHGTGAPMTEPDEINGHAVRSNSPQQSVLIEEFGGYASTLPNDEVASALNLDPPINLV